MLHKLKSKNEGLVVREMPRVEVMGFMLSIEYSRHESNRESLGKLSLE